MADTYECRCTEKKKFRVTFADCDNEMYIMEYCQKCYDQDDKQFMILEEPLE